MLAAALVMGAMLAGARAQEPLAEFGISSYYLTLGDTGLAPVTVRNPQASPKDIVLNLSGYPDAHFEYSCFPSECAISSSERDMDVFNMEPDEERTYYVKLVSAGIGDHSLVLESNTTSGSMSCSDTMSIRIGEPVTFPGLGAWAALAIVMLSCILVFLRG